MIVSSCSNDDSNKKVELTDSFCKIIRGYDEVGAFSEGFAPVKKGDKWGYINIYGEEVIPCRFSNEGGKFVGGFAKVDSIYINTDGQPAKLSKQEIVGLKSLAQDTVSLVKFEDNGLYGYKDKSGHIVIEPKYQGLGDFHNGVALALLTNASEVFVNADKFEFAGNAVPIWSEDDVEKEKEWHDIFDEVLIYGYVDSKGNSTFTTNDFSLIEEKLRKKEEYERKEEEELERIRREGFDWMQGTWRVELKDDNGGSLGYMYNTFDHGKVTMQVGDMTFEYAYNLSDDLREIEFGNGGNYMIYDKTIITNNHEYMEKVSDLSANSPASNGNSASVSSSQRDRELAIMNQLHELGEQGKRMMPRIEALYHRQQQAQRNGILSNPQAQYDLNDAINELIDIKNKQIRLAEQLGDQQLVQEYKEQRSKVYQAKDRMLYGI